MSRESNARQIGPIPDPFGSMRGSVTFLPGVDLTAPTGEEWSAEKDESEEHPFAGYARPWPDDD